MARKETGREDKFRWDKGDVEIMNAEDWEKRQAKKRNAPVKKAPSTKTGKKK